jgi:hypothetical protein
VAKAIEPTTASDLSLSKRFARKRMTTTGPEKRRIRNASDDHRMTRCVSEIVVSAGFEGTSFEFLSES